eukprot:TRINITY_DN18298_c0_g1_i3.p2 TRINITY_DN18298_c0_g1~~TRINITY_DN18298_c0_g1_i3.p2  ORF type:complete len:122 (-),score=10.21 TRINITY_DN18298_c0_g1_i3:42-407(-)
MKPISFVAVALLVRCALAQPFTLQPVLMSGDPVPGAHEYSILWLSPPMLARDGRIGFSVMSQSDLGERVRRLLVADPIGTLTLVASAGDSAPGGVGEYRVFFGPQFALDGTLAQKSSTSKK